MDSSKIVYELCLGTWDAIDPGGDDLEFGPGVELQAMEARVYHGALERAPEGVDELITLAWFTTEAEALAYLNTLIKRLVKMKAAVREYSAAVAEITTAYQAEHGDGKVM